jgi:RNA polymerase sigma-70 factor, ECF subfamily
MNQTNVTTLLAAAEAGDLTALDRALPLIYDELLEIAQRHLKRERSDHTLTPTALVHEAYLKLVDQTHIAWQGRGHFLGIASLAMRRILVNHARDRKRLKRGSNAVRLPLTESLGIATGDATDDSDFIIRLDGLLDRLADFDQRAAKVVECRYFAGLTVQETASVLQIGPATVKRDWALARAWLRREFSSAHEEP